MTNQPASLVSADYAVLLSDIKQRVRHGQTRAVLAVNAELIRLYWDIGALIHARQQREGWGAPEFDSKSRFFPFSPIRLQQNQALTADVLNFL